MSIRLMTAAWALNVSSTDKLVLLALADWSNDDGLCWPSLKQLCDKSGLSERAVRISIGRLRDDGHLTRNEVVGKGVNYIIHPGTTCPPAPNAPRHQMPETPARRAPNTPVTIIPQKASPSSERVRKPQPKSQPFRMPDEWKPTRFSDGTVAREIIDRRGREWGRAALEAFRHWAANADDRAGVGRKLNWQAAWAKWVLEQDKRDGRQADSMGRNWGGSAHPSGNGRVINAALGFIADGQPH